MAQLAYFDDSSDTTTATSGDGAIVCDKSTDVFTMQYYSASWAQIAIGGGTSPGSLGHAQYRNTAGDTSNAGDATSGTPEAWQTYPLTGEGDPEEATDSIADTITITYGTNQIESVPAGEYEIFGYAILNYIATGRIRLYDVTNSAAIDILSTSVNDILGYAVVNANCKAFLAGRFTLDDTVTLRWQYRVSTTNTGDGLGDAAGVGGWSEWYGKFEIRQVEAY